jgi:hypothetical protein
MVKHKFLEYKIMSKISIQKLLLRLNLKLKYIIILQILAKTNAKSWWYASNHYRITNKSNHSTTIRKKHEEEYLFLSDGRDLNVWWENCCS